MINSAKDPNLNPTLVYTLAKSRTQEMIFCSTNPYYPDKVGNAGKVSYKHIHTCFLLKTQWDSLASLNTDLLVTLLSSHLLAIASCVKVFAVAFEQHSSDYTHSLYTFM